MMKCSGCQKPIVAKGGESFGGTTTVTDGVMTSQEMYCPNCYNLSMQVRVNDEINKPNHYIFGPYELREVLHEWLDSVDIPKGEACDWFSMMQYLFRYPKKGKPARDLDKAMRYLKWIRERYD